MIETFTMPTVTAVGSAGSGAGAQTSAQRLNGLLLSIGVKQGNTPHANTDITITTEYAGQVRTLLTLTNYATTAITWHDIRGLQSDTVGAVITGATTPIALAGFITVTVAQGGNAATCDVVIVFSDDR